ncbi:MAG: pilus assembly protein PilP [Herminiimonas sp.]|nr:pilus assembly protein PilP [Herminiimonas sp.]
MTRPMLFRLVSLAVAAVLLNGCSDSGIELQQWMQETKQQTKINIPKLSEPKKFIPFLYDAKRSVDPYNPAKLAVALARAQSNSSSLLKPDMERRREPLESFPLDTLKMVGTLEKPGLVYALLQVDKSIFQAKVGNYIGQNFGMVTKVTDTGVEVKEIVQDASGDWVERQAKLELQESKK